MGVPGKAVTNGQDTTRVPGHVPASGGSPARVPRDRRRGSGGRVVACAARLGAWVPGCLATRWAPLSLAWRLLRYPGLGCLLVPPLRAMT